MWPLAFDKVIRRLAKLMIARRQEEISKLHGEFAAVVREHNRRVEQLFKEDVEVAQLRSWLDALLVVFKTYDLERAVDIPASAAAS